MARIKSRVEAELEIIRQLLKEYNKLFIGWRRFNLPQVLMEKIGRCRVVVTGCFHPAVFALTQGIPAIGLVKSITYIDIFSALWDQFGPGCQILHPDDDQLEDKLAIAIDRARECAEQDRHQLLDAAVRQIEWAKAGYP